MQVLFHKRFNRGYQGIFCNETGIFGVDVGGVKVAEGKLTSFDDVMTEKETGARTFFLSCGINHEFGIEDIDVDALDCKIFHIGYILLLGALDAEDEE